MGFLKNIYKQYIYGIIGTLVFHILLVSFFLLAEINIKRTMKEGEIVIEMPVIQSEEIELKEADSRQNELIPNNPSDVLNQAGPGGRTNMPSNKLAASDKFFDEDYAREVRSAQNLVKEVNKQLSREPENIEDIKMPVETTDGLDPESVKNKNYSGDSNISYYLDNRYHLRLPVPVYLAQGGGKVIVDITVNREGRVLVANPRESQEIRDPMIYDFARVAALHTLFNAEPSAPVQQTGTINYTFIAQ